MKTSTVLFVLSAVMDAISAWRLFKVSTEPLEQLNQIPLGNPTMTVGTILPLSQGSISGVGGVLLSDMIGIDKRINTFASLIREIESVSMRLDNAKVNTTVLAPLNSAIESLPRKPWEDPEDYKRLGSKAYDGGDGLERANRNLKRFVEAHIVTMNPWRDGEKATALNGDEMWWEENGGVRRIMPGCIDVQAVGRAVANGEVWLLKQVRNYAEAPA